MLFRSAQQRGEDRLQLQGHHTKQAHTEGHGDQILNGLKGLHDLDAPELLMPGDRPQSEVLKGSGRGFMRLVIGRGWLADG